MMATLRSMAGNIAMTLRPYRLSDDGSPAWLATHLEIQQDGSRRLVTVISLTIDDLAHLRTCLGDLVSGCCPIIVVDSTDEDFILEARRLEPPGHVAVGIWVGEPYGLMKGYRFVAQAGDIARFAEELESDERAVAGTNGSIPGR